MTYDLIILGSGPTGLYGAYFASFKKLKSLIIEINGSYGGAPMRLYPDKPLYDIPAHKSITGRELVENMYYQLNQTEGWEIIYNTEIINIVHQPDDTYILIDSKNNQFHTKNIVFATGYGAFVFKTFNDDVQIENNKIKYFTNEIDSYKDKHVVICGGGDSAIDYANLLKKYAKSINLIHRRDELRAKEHNVDKLKNEDNVNLHLNKSITKVLSNKIFIKDNEHHHTQEIIFDEILVFYGTKMVPNNIKIENLYNRTQKIEVDPLTNESINHKHIYACGLATSFKQEQTILTGISDIIKVVSKISKELKIS